MRTAPPEQPRRFRLRTIPVGIVGGFGVIFLSFAVAALAYMTYTSFTRQPMYQPGPDPGFTKDNLVITGIGTFNGVLLLFAAVNIWRGRWWFALLLIGVLVVVGQLLLALGIIRD